MLPQSSSCYQTMTYAVLFGTFWRNKS